MNKLLLLPALLCITGIGCAAPASQPQIDLALGKKVLFSPAPSYSATVKGGTDDVDLTDSKLVLIQIREFETMMAQLAGRMRVDLIWRWIWDSKAT
jgi:hypothetical protein